MPPPLTAPAAAVGAELAHRRLALRGSVAMSTHTWPMRNLLTVASRCAAVRSACSTSARSPSYTSAWKSCIASSSAPGGGGGSGGGGLVAAATSLVGGDVGDAARQRTAQQPRHQRHVLHHDLLQRESTSEEQSVIKALKSAGRGRGGART